MCDASDEIGESVEERRSCRSCRGGESSGRGGDRSEGRRVLLLAAGERRVALVAVTSACVPATRAALCGVVVCWAMQTG